MSSSAVESRASLATRVEVSADTITVELADGRTIAAPLAWYPRLLQATEAERRNWRLLAGGRGLHWPDIDEDISVTNLLAGEPSAESQTSFKKWLASRDDDIALAKSRDKEPRESLDSVKRRLKRGRKPQ
jgi:hypothetical protein